MVNNWIESIGIDWTQPQTLVALLVFASVVLVGLGILFWREQQHRAMSRRLAAGGLAYGPPFSAARPRSAVRLVEKIGNFVSHGQSSTNLWEQLMQAGYRSRAAPALYTGVKILLFAAGLTSAALLVAPH